MDNNSKIRRSSRFLQNERLGEGLKRVKSGGREMRIRLVSTAKILLKTEIAFGNAQLQVFLTAPETGEVESAHFGAPNWIHVTSDLLKGTIHRPSVMPSTQHRLIANRNEMWDVSSRKYT